VGRRPAMTRIAAPASTVVAREVIELHSRWDRPNFSLIANAMNSTRLPVRVDHGITVLISGPLPDMTIVLIDDPARRILPPRVPLHKTTHAANSSSVAKCQPLQNAQA
jgi:hypothetical protein